jgi:hypothetical protein
VLIAASYAVLVAGVAANLRYWGFRLLLVGLLLNAVVIGANGWRMPIDLAALARTGYQGQATVPGGPSLRTSKQAIVERSGMALWPLADVIAVPPVRRVISVGDTFAYTGVLVTLAGVISRWRRREAAASREVAARGSARGSGTAHAVAAEPARDAGPEAARTAVGTEPPGEGPLRG